MKQITIGTDMDLDVCIDEGYLMMRCPDVGTEPLNLKYTVYFTKFYWQDEKYSWKCRAGQIYDYFIDNFDLSEWEYLNLENPTMYDILTMADIIGGDMGLDIICGAPTVKEL